VAGKKGPDPEPVAVRVTYLDVDFEFQLGDSKERRICTVLGWELKPRWPGIVEIASEKHPESADPRWRAVSLIPESVVLHREEI